MIWGASPIGSGDYAMFQTDKAVSTAPLVTFDIVLDNCDGSQPQSYAFDNLGFTVIGATTTYDFTATPPTVMKASLSSPHLVAGSSTTPKVAMSVAGQTAADMAGEHVTLWKRAAGASTWSEIASTVIDDHGQAVGPVQKPTVNTSYQWRDAPLPGNIYLTAKPSTVTAAVAPKVTIKVAKATVHVHKKVVVTGTAKPGKRGLTVTLYRKHGKHKVKEATSKLKANGSYTIKKTLAIGKYKLFVTVASDSQNAKGTSATKSVHVIR